ncbi:MAG: hypothetical protein JEY94_15430 [Melioribacteraceae bacterium]|nr:hypothetical protein [Melioribacteraceae bacterium]
MSINEGLSHNLVLDITQDNTGYIWLATQDGLNKYDGYNFVNFNNDPNDYNSIGENWINSIEFDDDGNLWIGTWGNGLNLLKKGSKKFIRFEHEPGNRNSISNNWIQKLIVDKNNNIWMTTWGGGLNFYNPKTDVFKSYQYNESIKDGIPEDNLYALFESAEGEIWFGTNQKGLCKFDPKTEKFETYSNNLNNNDSRSNYVTAICEDSKGVLWVGTFGDGLHIFNKTTKKFENCKEIGNHSPKLITSIREDNDMQLWISSDDKGLFQYQLDNHKCYSIKNSNTNKTTFNDIRIWSVFEDRSGIIWVGTFSSGIGLYKKHNNFFGHINKNIDDPNCINNNFIKAIFEDENNNLWIGTDEGISILNRLTNKIEFLMHDPSKYNTLSNNRIRSIYKDKKGKFWILTWGGGINFYDPDRKTFKRFLNDKNNSNSLSDNYTKAIIEDEQGKLYIATEAGVNIFDPVKNVFSLISHNPLNAKSISSKQITSLTFNTDGRLWIGTQAGLNLYNLKTQENIRYLNSMENKQSLSNNRIRDIFIDSDNEVWIATLGGGINKFDSKTETFKRFNESDGLANNTAYCILEDNNKNIWISTNKGLSRLNKKTLKFKNFDKRDGLQSNEFNGGASFKNSATGELFFGGINGLNYFFPSKIKENNTVPPIELTKFNVNYNDYNSDKTLADLESVTLNYTENYIYLEFTALDFTSPSKNNYAYKLKGLEDSWVKSGNKNFANYTNLDPGEYVFKVKGTNNDGVWNTTGKELAITIVPPFWLRWYFKVFLFMAVVIIIVSFIVIRGRRFNQRKSELEALINNKTKDLYTSNELLKEANLTKDKFMSIMAHDLKNPFGAIINVSDLLLKDFYNLPDSEKLEMISLISNSSRKTLTLLENLLIWAQSQSDKIVFSPDKIKIKELITESILPYEFFAGSKQLKIKTEVDELEINADRFMLNTVIGNLINNAIKFSKNNSTITIFGFSKNGFTNIKVKDEGIGIDKNRMEDLFNKDKHTETTGTDSEKGLGLGLQLCLEFTQKHNGKIDVESELGKGSTFTIIIPEN